MFIATLGKIAVDYVPHPIILIKPTTFRKSLTLSRHIEFTNFKPIYDAFILHYLVRKDMDVNKRERLPNITLTGPGRK